MFRVRHPFVRLFVFLFVPLHFALSCEGEGEGEGARGSARGALSGARIVMARMRALVGMWRRWRILLSRCDGARRRLPCPFSPLAEASIPGGVAVGGFCVAPCRRRGDLWPRNRVLVRAGSVFPPISTLVEALAKETPGRRRIVANAPTVFAPERGSVAKNERFRSIGALRGARGVGTGGPRHVARRALARLGTRAASGTGVWRDVGARRRGGGGRSAGRGIGSRIERDIGVWRYPHPMSRYVTVSPSRCHAQRSGWAQRRVRHRVRHRELDRARHRSVMVSPSRRHAI